MAITLFGISSCDSCRKARRWLEDAGLEYRYHDIRKDGFGITNACRQYLEPLIKGEDYPPYVKGLPKYPTLKNISVKPRLGTKFVV